MSSLLQQKANDLEKTLPWPSISLSTRSLTECTLRKLAGVLNSICLSSPDLLAYDFVGNNDLDAPILLPAFKSVIAHYRHDSCQNVSLLGYLPRETLYHLALGFEIQFGMRENNALNGVNSVQG